MKTSTDYTGIAYLVGLAGLVGIGVWVYRQGFTSIADAAASAKRRVAQAAGQVATKLNPANPGNYANEVVSDMLSAAAGRPTSAGSLLADVLPSAAEREVNKPGFFVNPGKRDQAGVYRPKWDVTPGAVFVPDPFDPPPFILDEQTDTAPLYDPMGNRIH